MGVSVSGGAAAAAGAVTRAGGNTTEATTTSTATVTLFTISSLSLDAGVPVWVWANVRKTTGAAANMRAGVRLNATTAYAKGLLSAATNAAEDMLFLAFLGARVTSYTQAHIAIGGAVSPGTAGDLESSNAALPVATVTDILLEGRVTSASITGGYDEFHAYSLAVS